MLHLEKRHLAIIKSILSKYPYPFYAFGSRVKGNCHPLSDLDLCFMEPIPPNIISHLEEDFEESDLPYRVDIVNWQTCSQEFRSAIEKTLQIID
jgi:predicted nucleotidyltransferase